MNNKTELIYRGRIAPTPSGHLHKGHAHTFSYAFKRSGIWDTTTTTSTSKNKLILRIEDLDEQRCKPQYLDDMLEDLRWIGIKWNEGYNYFYTDINEQMNYMKTSIYNNYDNNFIYSLFNHINTTINDDKTRLQYINALQSYKQSERLILYKFAWYYLYKKGYIYPSHHSRKDVETALSAPHDENFNKRIGVDNDIIFPKTLRPDYVNNIYAPGNNDHFPDDVKNLNLEPSKVNWRYRVPDMECINFNDKRCGNQEFKSDIDFGDFLVWRLDGYPSYELAVVVDDIIMNITEIVRGEDLLLSTARQILLYNAFGISYPDFYHCPLVKDPVTGKRLAKREKALSLKELRTTGVVLSVDTIITEEAIGVHTD